MNWFCKDQIWVLSPKGGWTSAQRTQNNEFVENELENWVLINQTNVKVDPDNKWMKLNRFDYKVSSWLLQCFSLHFWSPILIAPPSFIPFSLFISTLHMQARLVDLDTCPINPFPKSLRSSCKAESYYSGITSTLMRLES